MAREDRTLTWEKTNIRLPYNDQKVGKHLEYEYVERSVVNSARSIRIILYRKVKMVPNKGKNPGNYTPIGGTNGTLVASAATQQKQVDQQ